jgi:hypothetical protein
MEGVCRNWTESLMILNDHSFFDPNSNEQPDIPAFTGITEKKLDHQESVVPFRKAARGSQHMNKRGERLFFE